MTVTVGHDSAKTRKTLSVGGHSVDYYSIPAAQDAGLGDLETRYELIGINSLLPQAKASTEPTEVRLRVATRAPTQRQALQVANEVEALYTNGPAAGGGASKSVREVVAATAVLDLLAPPPAAGPLV